MSDIARSRGIPGFTADVLASNRPMLAVFQKSGLKLEVELDAGTYHVIARFEEASAPSPE